ncbi:hypothetical protein ACHAWF_007179 [Thalassiosira exigua]
MAPEDNREAATFSVALIGSSGGGTATLGHTDPVALLTTVHRELLRVVDADASDDRRVCTGISHAIFVSLCDGSGFDAVRENDWMPGGTEEEGAGPMAALYVVGLSSSVKGAPFSVTRVDVGPLTRINRLARELDAKLGRLIEQSQNTRNKIAGMISLSSEPTVIHSESLSACKRLDGHDFPIVGSGGTSLSRIASIYDLRIVGNSGGSVASTSLTKARGWAMGLANEWGMTYDASMDPGPIDRKRDGDVLRDEPESEVSNSNPKPTLKSIMEAALPTFLFVSIARHALCSFTSAEDACVWDKQREHSEDVVFHTTSHALQHIVIGTTCCILAATSRSSSSDARNGKEDQSTLLMSATTAGVLASASASQASPSSYDGSAGGSALAGLLSGALIPFVLSKVSDCCVRYNVTATMTNVLCGGGVGMLVGTLMHISGVAHGLGLLTGVIRCLLRWTELTPPQNDCTLSLSWHTLAPCSMEKMLFPFLRYLQERWSATVPRPTSFLHAFPMFEGQGGRCSLELHQNSLPVPTGLGFILGCMFVYGSKYGAYHSLFLPLILLEMDAADVGGEASLLGAIDECTLVLVCAGICAANLLQPPTSEREKWTRVGGEGGGGGGGARSLSLQALRTNILCGDFIEAAYPSMDRSKLVNGAAYLAAGISTEIIVQRRVLSSAYLPLPLAIWISNDRWGMAAATFVAFAITFIGTLVSNAVCSWG